MVARTRRLTKLVLGNCETSKLAPSFGVTLLKPSICQSVKPRTLGKCWGL